MANKKNEKTIKKTIEKKGKTTRSVSKKVATGSNVGEKDRRGVIRAESAEQEITMYGIFEGKKLVKLFKDTSHGLGFKKLAEEYAKRKNLTAEPYVPPVEGEEEVDENSIKVLSKNGEVIRVFSLTAHGEDYEKLAKQFVAKYEQKRGYRI